MNLIELQRALKQLRLGGIAAVLETRLHQAQTEPMAPIDLIFVWFPMNFPGAVTACWNAGEKRPSSVIRRSHSTTSTSTSIRR